MFFGDSGSIAGGRISTLPSTPGGHVVLQVEDLAVVGLDHRHHALDRRPGWASRGRCGSARSSVPGGPVQVAAQRGRLGVVDDHVVVVAVELRRVQLVVAVEDLPVLLGQPVRVALERVVEQLRDVEELLAPEDDLPVATRGRRRASAGPARRGSPTLRRPSPSRSGAARACPGAAPTSAWISSTSARPIRCL